MILPCYGGGQEMLMRILVVEDERDLNRVISKRLESEGYSVDRCFDGEEALDFIDVGEFDAIIMEITDRRA